MKRSTTIAVLLMAALALGAGVAYAQSLSFRLEIQTADVFLEVDGTYRIVYAFRFANNPSGAPIDFIDIGLPSTDYRSSDIRAFVEGRPITDISPSPYVEGVALGLGPLAIPPGATGEVVVEIDRVGSVMYRGDDEGYASGQFSPTWFGSEFVSGTSDLTVTFHLPPGVTPDEPRWHIPRGGWPTDEPVAGYDGQGRITYTWHNPSAQPDNQYTFGASFPDRYVDLGSLQIPSSGAEGFLAALGIIIPCLVPAGFFAVILVVIVLANRGARPAYLPPKIAIEGHGIKRGLTAVEAAVLLQTGLDKVLTMILFAVIKKGAARVVTEEPLKVEAIEPAPAELRAYETAFLNAVVLDDRRKRQRELTEVMIQLVRAVESKMKGFSLRETREYYNAIIKKAWQQVEEAQTPQVKSERFTESMEWTMMDRDFDGRTRRTFGSGPIFLPHWWGSYRPTSTPARTTTISRGPVGAPSGGGGSISLPHLPGSEFAASFARGVQGTANNLVQNVTAFTTGVTRTTNPPPPPSKSSSFGRSSGGRSCACACACAGCACACAGGGR